MFETARAKINLFLHVTGKRADGFHDLQSLAVFADAADALHAEPAAALSLRVTGPFAADVPTDETNLVLRAARALQQELNIRKGAALTLEKHLPVASGIGGGSADAAAALRLLAWLWEADISADALERLALSLGSDLPMCLRGQSVYVSGRGEHLQPVSLPPLHVVLVNPGIAVSTKDVFAAIRAHAPAIDLPQVFASRDALIDWLQRQRNDLQPAAIALAPSIHGALNALQAQPGCLLARMSGSGATCFGVFAGALSAERACAAIQAYTGWWVRAAVTR